MRTVFIDELIASAVAKTSVKLLPALQLVDSNIQQIHFQHGHPREIVGLLKDMSQANSKKALRYPIVALFRDFPEEKGIVGMYAKARVQIIIATRTKPTYYAEERKEKTFKPILYPILNELLNQMLLSGNFLVDGVDGWDYTQIDRYFWGREAIYGAKENVFSDWIDCIQLQDLILKPYLKKC